MATPIQPFLDPSELEALIAHHLLQALRAEFNDDPKGREQALERARQLKGHRSIS
jgi:hypothetical protein